MPNAVSCLSLHHFAVVAGLAIRPKIGLNLCDCSSIKGHIEKCQGQVYILGSPF